MRHWKALLLSLLATCGVATANAADVNVPAPLEPWRAWVLDRHPDLGCPPHYASLGERFCRWPSQLALQANAGGASFTQDWQLYREGWVTLPGDSEQWPLEVRVDDRSVAVIERDGRPAVFLPAGEHQVRGSFVWDALPARLALPADSGLLDLRLNGLPVARPTVDAQGMLLFGESEGVRAETVADSLSVQVFRHLQDDIPLQLDTIVRFRVAGRDRELLLGQLLLDGYTPLAFDSPLPARIEADGRLRIQLRAGEWQVRLHARAEGQPTTFASKPLDDSWPAEELWSLRDNRSLRQVSLAGAASIDPSQTDMPGEWRELPAWLLRPGDQLQLTEHQRGNLPATGSAGEELSLVRDLWLDFDGQGLTSRDRIDGVLQQAARFSTAPGQLLGRAEVNGEPQLVTRLGDRPDEAGLELRPGPLHLLGLSRIEQTASLTATGWQHDFNRVSATLHLPPGWLLLHAAGADSAAGSWLARWSLWAIFLVLIVGAAAGRLLGWRAGLTALLALLLTYHAPYAPVFLWLAALVGIGLLRVLPAGKPQRWLQAANTGVFIALLLVLLNFAVDQARRSLYPQLEMGRYMNIQQRDVAPREDEAMAPAAAPAREIAMKAELAEGKMADNALYGSLPVPQPRKLKTGYDSGAKVQTGPGEPAWGWQQVALHWSGPVTRDQPLQLHLLSPGWHRLWNLASVLLVFAFASQLLRAAWPGTRFPLPAGRASAPVIVLVAAGLLPAPPAEAQGFPDPALLQELEQRLTRLPDCEPQCASFQRGLLQLDEQMLRLALQVDTQQTVAVPLPSARNDWQPRSVLVDGDPMPLRRDDNGLLWAVLTPGSHRLLLEGPVSGDRLQLPFAMAVHHLAVDADGWQVSGLNDGRVPGGSLQLQREPDQARQASDNQPLLADTAPPFLRVTRTLLLGLDWQVQTEVERLAPASGAIAVPVNLLPGEAVLTPGVEVRDGKVLVMMSAYSPSFSWHSSLKQGSSLELTAAANAPWVEHWQFDVAPVWHVDVSGPNPVKQDMQAGQLPRWQPWPGESLALAISRPEAVSGPTRTIEAAALDFRPGARSADVELTLDVRSSQGGELPLALPPGSQLQRVVVDGIEQGNPADPASLRLPLRPGNQQISVSWRQDGGIGWRSATPLPQLDEPLSNISLKLQLPHNRWLLAAGGPAMGPALLFWGVLVVIVLVAIGLGRSRLAPVATWQWLLLGIGMSTINSAGSLLVVAWFIAMARRAALDTQPLSRSQLQWLQVGLVLLTVLALGSLISTIPLSLLSTPDMQVAGNQSSAHELLWFQDRTAQGLPQAWTVSLPMWAYRAAMLAWSLWLVFALLGWCRWGWDCFSRGELWRSQPSKAATSAADAALTLDSSVLGEQEGQHRPEA